MPDKNSLFPNLKEPKNLSEKVYFHLEQAILSGTFPAGSRLPTEPELCTSFGVSRTVIREAIQNLKAQGLVNSKIGSGTYVTEDHNSEISRVFTQYWKLYLNERRIFDYLELRTVLELECVERVTRAQDPECIRQLEDIVRRMKDPALDTIEKFYELDMEFHLTMASFSGNSLFKVILEPLRDFGIRFGVVRSDGDSFRDKQESLYREHDRLLRLIRTGQTDKAKAFFRRKLEQNTAHVRSFHDSQKRSAETSR
ncbi:MAG: FadR/GntR family transcriptional regulator [Opitutaceae bacterium]